MHQKVIYKQNGFYYTFNKHIDYIIEKRYYNLCFNCFGDTIIRKNI